MSFKTFIDLAKSIIEIGAKANASARADIRNAVGELGDELDRALSIADSYLIGAKFSEDDHKLARHLACIDGTLMNSYHEHQICVALDHMADRFKQTFDPAKFSVSLSRFNEIQKLIEELKNRERVVLDDLSEITDQLRDISSQLLDGDISRKEVLESVERHRNTIGDYRKEIKNKRRELLDNL